MGLIFKNLRVTNTSITAPPLPVWTASGSMSTVRQSPAGSGTRTTTLVSGGIDATTTYLTSAEKYNGSTWSTTGSMASARSSSGQVGTSSAAMAFGGWGGSPTNTTENFNGTTWATGATMASSVYSGASFGTTTAAMYAGGWTGAVVNATQTYNGTSWTSGATLSTGRYSTAGAGTLAAGAVFGGTNSSSVNINSTEEYNGTSWVAGGAQLFNTSITGNIAGNGGTTNSAICCGGQPVNLGITQTYNAGVWTLRNNLNTPRDTHAVSGDSTQAAAFGGRNSTPAKIATTENYV